MSVAWGKIHFASVADRDHGVSLCGRRLLGVESTADADKVTCAHCRKLLARAVKIESLARRVAESGRGLRV